MKQLIQNLKNGNTFLDEVPAPLCRPGHVLIASRASLISVGTERMLVEFGKANLIQKVRQQPEKVRQVLDKIRTDGVLPTVEAVFSKLDEPLPLGYCNAGVVAEIADCGLRIADFKIGDRVVSNGPHAEFVCVPKNLCAKIPDNVSDEEAAFTVLGAIALQGIRLAAPTLGERFIVFGLGLVGLLAVQLLRASGCPVLAVDFSETRLRLAEGFGAEVVNLGAGADPVAVALDWSGGKGVDGAIIAASANGDEIVHQAASACRKQGRIILVGVVDLNLQRSDFYEKEIMFQVSCSYGPGRYDEKYEEGGQDYPFGFVRWTEQRNFEAVLEAMREGQMRVKELITHRVALEDAAEKYDGLLHDPGALGIVIQYPNSLENRDRQIFLTAPSPLPSPHKGEGEKKVVAGIIGAGNFARAILLPALKRTGVALALIADINPVAAAHAARKFGAGQAVSDAQAILDDPAINTVFVVVGHHLHARFVCDALTAGKHIYVEKPLCLNEEELKEIISTYNKVNSINKIDQIDETDQTNQTNQILMVGFNRRFSPHTEKIKKLLLGRREPLCMTVTVNAGFIPPEHWTQDPERGGGRIIGEGCHFIDLLSFLAESSVVSIAAMMAGGSGPVREDRMSIVLGFADGSVGTVHYFANGSRSYPKETLEVFSEGRVIRMENFRVTRGYGFRGFSSFRTWRQDKGHRAEVSAFVDLVEKGGKPLIPFPEIVNVTLANFAAVEAARSGRVIFLDNR